MRSLQLSKDSKCLYFISVLSLSVEPSHSQPRAFALSLVRCGTHIHYGWSFLC